MIAEKEEPLITAREASTAWMKGSAPATPLRAEGMYSTVNMFPEIMAMGSMKMKETPFCVSILSKLTSFLSIQI